MIVRIVCSFFYDDLVQNLEALIERAGVALGLGKSSFPTLYIAEEKVLWDFKNSERSLQQIS